MKVRIFVVLMLCVAAPVPHAWGQQSWSLYGAISRNSFAMSDLKDLQQEELAYSNSNGIPATITDAYPSYIGYQAGVVIPLAGDFLTQYALRLFVEYTSTGGRIDYEDYSGEYRIDQVASATSLGAAFDYRRYYGERFLVKYTAAVRVLSSKLSSSSILRIGNSEQQENLDFNAVSPAGELGITPSYDVGAFNLGLSLSYLLDPGKSLQSDRNSNAYLINQKDQKVNINWSGFRAGLVLEYVFNRTQP